MSLMFGINSLRGKKVMIVEDEAILALDLMMTVEETGATVAGPVHRLDVAMKAESLDELDAAILDVDVAGEEVFPFADRLRAAGVPMVFHTGRSDIGRLIGYDRAVVCRKPCLAGDLVEALRCLVRTLDVSESVERPS